jgi:hypothetical protein
LQAFIKPDVPIDCSEEEEDWVSCFKSACVIKKHIIEKKGSIICEFTDIFRKNDYQNEFGETTKSRSKYLLQNSDFVKIKCKSEDGSRWFGTKIGIRKDIEIVKRKKKVNGVNILMFGFGKSLHLLQNNVTN